MKSKMKLNIISKQIYYSFIIIAILLAYFPNTASAAGVIDARKVQIGNSLGDATSTTYNFTFTAPSATPIKSIGFQACLTASSACGTVTGFSASASTLTTSSGIGTGVWTVNTGTSNELRIYNDGTNATSPSANATVNFSGVHNPTAPNTTFYIRITTYSAVNWTGAIDTGTVAFSTAGQITINASVDETLTFTLASNSITLSPNPLSSSTTGTGTSSMTVATNAQSGYTVTYSGNTLTSGSNTLTAMTGTGSVLGNVSGNSQFGINLRQNTTPTVGTDKSGIGTGGTYSPGYGTVDSFKFLSGDAIAASTTPTNANTFTTSYIANIASTTPAGAYTTTLTYVATANF